MMAVKKFSTSIIRIKNNRAQASSNKKRNIPSKASSTSAIDPTNTSMRAVSNPMILCCSSTSFSRRRGSYSKDSGSWNFTLCLGDIPNVWKIRDTPIPNWSEVEGAFVKKAFLHGANECLRQLKCPAPFPYTFFLCVRITEDQQGRTNSFWFDRRNNMY